MNIYVFKCRQSAARHAAEMLADFVAGRPRAVLGLATGGTMPPVYENFLSISAQQKIALSGIRSFNLDEYVGLPSGHSQSYCHFMRQHLFDHIDADKSRLALPHGDAVDAASEAHQYDEAIRQAGGIDLQLLGLGANGHIGFNEPGSSFSSRTRVESLSDETRFANARFFANGEDVPSHAITMGIGTILEAKRILLLATGIEKASASRAMIEGTIDEQLPASALRRHADVTILLDEAAASQLSPDTQVIRYRGTESINDVA